MNTDFVVFYDSPSGRVYYCGNRKWSLHLAMAKVFAKREQVEFICRNKSFKGAGYATLEDLKQEGVI